MRRLLTVAIAALFIAPTTSDAHSKYRSEWKSCVAGNTHACVQYVVDYQHIGSIEASWMFRIPGCESTWLADPPHNNPSRGLYQFVPSTWAGTPYGKYSILDPLRQAQAAAYVYHRDGGGGEWTCK